MLVALAPPAAAAAKPRPGSFDRSFGGDGRVVLNLPGEGMSVSAMAVQADGKIVVVGSLSEGRVLAVRFRRRGTLDPSFGSGGVVRARLSRPVGISAVAIQPDGKLVLGGSALIEPARANGAVLRLLPDGRVDTEFGENGLALIDPGKLDFGTGSTSFTRVALQPDGRIVAAGEQGTYDVSHTGSYTVVARLLADGRADETFDSDGVGWDGGDHPGAIVIHPDGNVFILGWYDVGVGDYTLYAIRFSSGPAAMPPPAANPDQTSRSYVFKSPVTLTGAHVASNGSVVVAADLSPGRFAWLRLTPGLRELERRSVRSEGAQAVAFDARGALITAGLPSNRGASPIGLARYRGRRFRHDLSFGRRGNAFVSVKDPAQVVGTAVHADKLLLAATTDVYGPVDHPLTLVRLHAHQDGSGPIATVRGLPRRGCVQGLVRPLVRVRDESAVRVEVRVDRRVVARSRRKRLRLRLDSGRVAPGSHRLVVRARDAAGNAGRFGTTFLVCGRG